MAGAQMKPINVGLLGIGTVGRGTCDVLRRNEEEITRRAGRPIRIDVVATRTLDRAREGTRGVAGVNLTNDPAVVVRHPDVDIVVELIGGIEPARTLVLEAIAQRQARGHREQGAAGAARQRDLRGRAAKGVMVAFEAAVAGGIPIIKALREGLTANRIEWIAGIINGTSPTSSCRKCARRARASPTCWTRRSARLRRSRSDVRHRRHRRRAQADDHVGDRLRHSDAVRQGLRRGHLQARRAKTSATPRNWATASSCSASRGAQVDGRKGSSCACIRR